NIVVQSATTTVAGQLAFVTDDQTTVEFTPSGDLQGSTDYALVIMPGVVDRDSTMFGQRETISFTTATAPTTPDKLAFTSVSAGPKHTCGVTTSGAAYCWGDNAWGQLGTGNTASSASPVPVAGGIAFQQISAAESFTCGVATTGAAFCWGSNAEGLLGVGLDASPESCLVANQVTACSTTPRNVAGGLAFTSVSSHGGAYLTFFETGVYNGVTVQGFTCGVTVPGAAYCWGSYRHMWFTAGGAAPVLMAAGRQFASISTGMFRACGVSTSGAGYCWGSNFWGGLGSGTLFTYPSGPQAVAGGHTFRAIAMEPRNQTACGITMAGAGYCWGAIRTPTSPSAPDCVWPDDGSVVPCSVTPLPMSGGISWSALTLGWALSCGLNTEGRAYCWGFVTGGTSIVPVATTLRFTSISSGGNYACGVSVTDGAVYCWGYGQYGQLGSGQIASTATTPVRVGGRQ
ncbi:MAG: Ig-like domain-containing protein, partial [Gemmatimonadales bacterium]